MHKRLGRLLTVLLTLVLFKTALAPALAETGNSGRTNVIKAGMINGFAAYTTWPMPTSNEPFVIGVMGGDQQFIKALERFFERKPSSIRQAFEVRSINMMEVDDCRVVVILGKANVQAQQLLAKVSGKPILTISDDENFTNAGGHVNFFRQSNKLRFAINWKSTTESKLKISSRLLRIARVVGERP